MSSPNTTQKRYPGVKPFETSERDLFFGRDRDIEDLLDLVWLEKLVVLFGKSGYGKSSLINAGILPEIEAEAVPIVVRLGSYVAEQTPAPLDNLRLKINELLEDNPEAAFLDALNLPSTLWQQVKRKQSPQQRRFVLIFDQFEEFFTYPLAEQQAFKEQIADLLYTEVPQAVRNQNDTLSASQQAFIATAFDAKVLLAIRADRMSLLDSMKDKMPAILQKRYELKGLSEAQAQEAIVGPAQQSGEFVSPVFAYSPEALKVMTQKLAASKSSQRSGIEAFQLQILCEYLEDKVIKGEIPGQRVVPQHFAEQIDEIFEGYYQRLLDKLEPGAQEAAQLLIEEKLLFEDANTGDARRLGVDSGVLLAEKDISQSLLNQLESNFLLRRESTSTGGFNYEVSHDTLIAPILKSKAERREKERLDQEKKEARRRRNRLLAILGLTGLVLAVVVGVLLYILKISEANRQQALTAYANDLAYKSTIALERGDRTTAFQLAVMAHRYVQTDNPNVTRALVEALYYNDVPAHTPLPWSAALEGHTSYVFSVAFSPDGQRLATGSEDNSAKIWDLQSGKQTLSLDGHTSSVTSVAFSPDGQRLATGSEDNSTKIWDLQSGKQTLSLDGHTSYVTSVAFSPDGQRLATGSSDNSAKIWDLQSGKQTLSLQGHTSSVWSVAFSPDGKSLATGSLDKTAKIWDLQSGKQTLSLKGHASYVFSVAFSPDGQRLATGSSDNSSKIWDLQSGKQTLSLKGHTSSVLSVAFSLDGQRLATGSHDKTAKIWDLQSGKLTLNLQGHTSSVSMVAFSPDGISLATGSYDNTTKIWDLQSGKQTLSLKGHTSSVWSVAFSPNGQRLATGSEDNTAKIWDLQSGKQTLSLKGHTDYVLSVAFSPDDQRVATGSLDKTAKIWDLQSGKQTLSLQGHTDYVGSVAFSPDGQKLATGSEDNTAKIWDLQSGKQTLSLQGHTESVYSVAFSPDGQRLATGSLDNTAKIWDLQSGKQTLSLQGHTESVYSVAFSPDGQRLATGSEDNTAKIWDLQSGKQTLSLKGHTDYVTSVAFFPDGQKLATGSVDNTAKIWDLQFGKLTLSLKGHTSSVSSVAFSPDGQKLATGSRDSTAKIWDFTPEGWRSTPQGKNRQLSGLDAIQLASYNLETLLDLHPDNEAKLIATREVWQIKAFADLAAAQAGGSNVLSRVEAPYARANRLYAAALALQDELLIKMDWAKMLRKWAAVYRDDGKEGKAKELEGKADGLWKEEK